MKYILLVGDGMGDLPVPELEDKTPLEAARKPAIDRLAAAGELLQVRTVPKGYPPGSDVANLSLLGYAPEQCYSGRAPLEAAAMGVAIPPGALAFRCNLVTLERRGDRLIMVDYSAGHITTDEAAELIHSLQERCGNERLAFHPGVSYRHLLIHQGDLPGLTTVPPHDYTGRDVSAPYQEYLRFGHLAKLMADGEALLAAHPVNAARLAAGKKPANGIWLWGEGRTPSMEPLTRSHGISGSLISAVDLLRGLGVLSGLDVIKVEGATGYLDTNYEGKARAALTALRHQDFVLVHVEAPDEAGHQGLVAEKVRAIEEFSERIVAPVAEEMERRGEPFRLVVTMDHFTPLVHRTHVDWPVPMLLYDSRGVARPSVLAYNESNARQWATDNGLVFPGGPEFFHYFLERQP